MKVCYKAGAVTARENYYSIAADAVEIRLWFLTDDILRIRAGFDGDWDEASYSLVMTAWESRTDHLLAAERRRVETANARLTDAEDKAVIQGSKLRVEIEKDPFRICVYDAEGTQLHADIPDLAYREDANSRRFHASQIEAEDCFYGFGEKSGDINKAEKFMNMAPGMLWVTTRRRQILFTSMSRFTSSYRDSLKRRLVIFTTQQRNAPLIWDGKSATTGTDIPRSAQMQEMWTFS